MIEDTQQTCVIYEHFIKVFSVNKITNLGVILDKTLSVSCFIDKKCSTCLFYLKSISKIRKYLTIDATK